MFSGSISFVAKCRVSVIAIACALGFAGTAHADILIRNVTLYDGTGAQPVRGANILVKGERIAQVSTSPIQAGGATVIDGTGKFVMPGMNDSHIHVKGGQGGPVFAGNNRTPINEPQQALPTLAGFIYSGVTSVYDSANNEPFLYPLREQERSGKIVSPRLFVAGGAISVPDGTGAGPTALKVTTWDETKKGLDDKITRKPDMFKMILTEPAPEGRKATPSLTSEQIKSVTDYARQHGLRVTAHAMVEQTSAQAINNGVVALAHSVLRGPPMTDGYLKLLVDRKIPVSTTTVGFATIGKLGDEGGMGYLDDRLFKDTFTEEDFAAARGSERDNYIKFGVTAQFKAGEAKALGNIKQMYDAGVYLTAGTDKAQGPYMHMELAFLNRAGIPPAALIRIATLNGAMYVGQEKDLGSIEAGKYADLLVLRADPGADVKNFQAIDEVIKNGQRIDLKKLDLPVNRRK